MKKRTKKAKRTTKRRVIRRNPRRKCRVSHVAKCNPRRRKRRAAVKRQPTPRRRTARRTARRSKVGAGSLIAVNSGGRIVVAKAVGSRVVRVGTFSRQGLRKYCAKNGIKMR